MLYCRPYGIFEVFMRNVRQAAVQELARGWKDDPSVFDLLFSCVVNDPFENRFLYTVRQTALNEIVRLFPDHPQTLDLLKDRAVNDPDEQLRKFAKKVLEKKTNAPNP